MKLVFKILFRPRQALSDVLSCSLRCSVNYALSLASLGSILSFISLYFIKKESFLKVLNYVIVIYFLDLISVVVFGLYLSKRMEQSFKDAFRLSVFSTVPVWLSDLVDIYQPLRPLSTLGLLYSVYILFLWLRNLQVESIPIHLGVYVMLYVLNAVASEAIIQNPVVREILKGS